MTDIIIMFCVQHAYSSNASCFFTYVMQRPTLPATLGVYPMLKI